MDGIRLRMRSESKIALMHVLGVKVLHDLIRKFARDSVPPTPACNFVRNVAASILRRCFWSVYWERNYHDYEGQNSLTHLDCFLNKHLTHSFELKYDRESRMVRLKHRNVANHSDHDCIVKITVLKQEIVEEGWIPHSCEFEQITLTRLRAWKKLVRGRTWTAVCADNWNMWPIAKIRAVDDLSCLLNGLTLCKKKGEKIHHIIDLSTLKVLRD